MVVLGLMALLLAGCRPAETTPAGGEAAAQQNPQMTEMMQYLKENNASFEDLKEQLQQLRSQEEDRSGVKALGEDLQVVKALVSAARQAATDKKSPETTAALERLAPALISLRAGLPAAKVTEAVERAAAALNSYQVADAVKIASHDLLQAKDVCENAPATLSPDVLKDLDSAKGKVDKQDVSGANQALLGILKTLGNDESVRTAAQALATTRGAEDAVGQGAWVVVLAQMDYLDSLLATLSQKVEGAQTAVSGEQAPGTAAGGEAQPGAAAANALAAPEASNALAPEAEPAPPAPAAAAPAQGATATKKR
jgi:hypothetical protein